jgi:hypothetical protein
MTHRSTVTEPVWLRETSGEQTTWIIVIRVDTPFPSAGRWLSIFLLLDDEALAQWTSEVLGH